MFSANLCFRFMNDERKQWSANQLKHNLCCPSNASRASDDGLFDSALFILPVTLSCQQRVGVKRVVNKLKFARSNGLQSEIE